jgi:hypothetical protein
VLSVVAQQILSILRAITMGLQEFDFEGCYLLLMLIHPKPIFLWCGPVGPASPDLEDCLISTIWWQGK